MPGSGQLLEHAEGRYVLEACFQSSLHDEVTPARMILLRILNMTLLRVQRVADWFRKLVVRRLMSGRVAGPLKLRREINLVETAVQVTDNITGDAGFFDSGLLSLYLCRRITGIHMASARYFQQQELEDTGKGWLEATPLSLNTAITRVVTTGRAAR